MLKVRSWRTWRYHRQPSGFLPIWLLISAIFYPAEYRKLARVDVRGNACTVINKTKRKRNDSRDSQEVVTQADIDRLENEIFRIYKIDAAWRLSKPIRNI